MAYPTRNQLKLFVLTGRDEASFKRNVDDLLETWANEVRGGRDVARQMALSIYDYVAVVNSGSRIMTVGNYLNKVTPVGAPAFFDVVRSQFVELWRRDSVQFVARIKQMFAKLLIQSALKQQDYIVREHPILLNTATAAAAIATLIFHYSSEFRSLSPGFDLMTKFKQYIDRWYTEHVERILAENIGRLTVTDTDADDAESLADATSAVNKGRPLPANTILATTVAIVSSSSDDEGRDTLQAESFLNPTAELFRVFDSVRLLLITFRESYKNCDQITPDTATLAFAGLSDSWTAEILDEFNLLEKRVEQLNVTGILTPPVAGESAEHYLHRVSRQLSDSKLINIENRLQRMVEEVRLKCPQKKEGWFVPPFSPGITFSFKRDSIPDDINAWLVSPLQGTQNPKAVIEVILNNGGACPDFRIGQTLLDGWQVKIVSRISTNPYWKTGELLAKKMLANKIDSVMEDPIASMNALWSKARTLPQHSALPATPIDYVERTTNVSGSNAAAVWEAVRMIVDVKDAFEPLMAQYMQQVTRCGIFLGVQKPSEDDDKYDTKSSDSQGIASSIRGSIASIISDLARDWIEIGKATLSLASGSGSVIANMSRIATAFASITYTLTVRTLIQTGLGGAFRSLISHPFIGGSLILMGVSASSVALPLMMGYAAGTTVLPAGAGFWSYLTSSIFAKIVDDIGVKNQFGLSPYNLSSIFTTWGSMINLLRAVVCGDSLYSKLAQTAIKYYVGRLFTKMLAQVGGGSGSGSGTALATLAKMANWWEACFGTILQQVISMVCAGNLDSLLWIWDATSNLRNSVSGFYKSLPSVLPPRTTGSNTAAESYGTATTGITSVLVTGRNKDDLFFQTMDGETYKTSARSFSQLARYTTGRPGQQQQYESQLDGYLKTTSGFRVDSPQRHALVRSIDIQPMSELPSVPSLFETIAGGRIDTSITMMNTSSAVDRNMTAFATDAFKNAATASSKMQVSVANTIEIKSFTRPSFPKVADIRETLSSVSASSADVIGSTSFKKLESILNNSGTPMTTRVQQAESLLASDPKLASVIAPSAAVLEERGFGETIKGPLMFVAQMAVFMAAATVGTAAGIPMDAVSASMTGMQVLAQTVNF